MASSGMVRRVALVVLTRAIRRNISEDAILHSHRRENIKFYMGMKVYTKFAMRMEIELFILTHLKISESKTECSPIATFINIL
jgi:hypothetical protein